MAPYFIGIPNLLTALRIVLIPIILFFIMIPGFGPSIVAFILFVFAIITDFLDGLLARKLNSISKFGKMLDPIADKLLICSALIMLVKVNKAHIIPVIIIICRELFVSGMREFLGQNNQSMPVNSYGKWKTTLQCIAVAVFLFPIPVGVNNWVANILLWIAALLSLLSMYSYCRVMTKQIFSINDSQ